MGKRRTIKTTITYPDDLHWAFEEARIARRLEKKEAIEQALSQWIDRPLIESIGGRQYLQTHHRAHDQLESLLQSGLNPDKAIKILKELVINPAHRASGE